MAIPLNSIIAPNGGTKGIINVSRGDSKISSGLQGGKKCRFQSRLKIPFWVSRRSGIVGFMKKSSIIDATMTSANTYLILCKVLLSFSGRSQ